MERGTQMIHLHVSGYAWNLPALSPNDLVPQALLRFAHLPYTLHIFPTTEVFPTDQPPMVRGLGVGVRAVFHPQVVPCLLNLEGCDKFQLEGREGADVVAYSALMENKLNLALKYHQWYEIANYKHATGRSTLCGDGTVLRVWGLRALCSFLLHWAYVSCLNTLRWNSPEKVYPMAADCYKQLAIRLGSEPYFHGTSPGLLDAVVFGHLCFHVFPAMPRDNLREMVVRHPTLVLFCRRVLETYFADWVEEHPTLLEDIQLPDKHSPASPKTTHPKSSNNSSNFTLLALDSLKHVANSAVVDSRALLFGAPQQLAADGAEGEATGKTKGKPERVWLRTQRSKTFVAFCVCSVFAYFLLGERD